MGRGSGVGVGGARLRTGPSVSFAHYAELPRLFCRGCTLHPFRSLLTNCHCRRSAAGEDGADVCAGDLNTASRAGRGGACNLREGGEG